MSHNKNVIDQAARRESKAVAAGLVQPTDEMHPKIALYGLFAQALHVKQVQDIQLCKSLNIEHLDDNLYKELGKATANGYHDLGRNKQDEMLDYFIHQYPEIDAEEMFVKSKDLALSRLKQGTGTGVMRETQLLKTIMKKQSEGQTITTEGLMRSSRVLVASALQHLSDLTATDTLDMHFWCSPFAEGRVYKDDVTEFHPETGLHLRHASATTLELGRSLHGPRIGCPASFIKGYVTGIHEVAAKNAIESGLIKVTD